MRCDSMERGCQWTGTIGTLDNHIATCQFALVPCPNKCEDDEGAGELYFMRKDLDDHLKTKCRKRAYECQHCGEKGTYRYASITEDHDKVCDKRETREKHMDLALATVSSREEQHKTLSEGEAIVFKLPGYASKKKKNEIFYSPPFYTSSGGYRMRIRVDANGVGDGKGTHVSVFTKLLEGRYDDQLHWPFLGTVTFKLLNLEYDQHYSGVCIYDADDDMQVGSCRGCPKFLPHSSLSNDPATNTQYLLDDTLLFRVSVTVDNHKPWLVCTHHGQFSSSLT